MSIITADDIHWFEPAFQAFHCDDMAGCLTALEQAVSYFMAKPKQPVAWCITPNDPSGTPFLSFTKDGFPKDHFLCEPLS